MNSSRLGSSLDDFLREEKLLEAAEAVAAKRVIAFRIEHEMKQRQLSKSELAARMKTSRAAVERLLDPANTSVTLATLGRAAAALGTHLTVEFSAGSRASVRRSRNNSRSMATRSRR
ncbi:MAG: helix-turn-helix transcriptional regulator [Anaerolineales bacterium]